MQEAIAHKDSNGLNRSQSPLLSIVIPAHNEEFRLPPSLEKIDAFLKTQPYEAEVIVVENGSTDRTVEVTEAFAKTHPYVRVIKAAVRGKGLAVKVGMLEAHGEYRFICDADLSMKIEDIVQFLPPNNDGADVIIASREGKGANRVGEPTHRHLIGRINNWIIQLTAVRGFQDTQCGFKMFNRKAAEDLFSVQQMVGIGFDIELLFIAKKRGYKIKEVPITWYFDPDSRMRLVGDSAYLLVEIWQIRRNWLWVYMLNTKRANKTASLLFEKHYWSMGYQYVLGLDEAGRGTWAGPVSAAAVCLPPERDDLPELLLGVRDSKQMTPRQRVNLVETIQNTAVAWGVGSASAAEIDEMGIVPATRLAMRRALEAAKCQPDMLLIDSVKWPEMDVPQQSIIKGDSLSLSIAAASILAKVWRDEYMRELDLIYPNFGFAHHKGYGTAQHQRALGQYGVCPEHGVHLLPFAFL